VLDYLTSDEEMQVIGLTTTTEIAHADPVTSAGEILEFQQLVRMVPISESVARYAVELVRATRFSDSSAPDFIKKYVNYGASVRGAQFLVLAGKARALMRGRYHVSYDDITALVRPVLRHRILLNFHAESERLSSDDILKRLLEWKPAPRGE
jgi:MoxR-like ATPase